MPLNSVPVSVYEPSVARVTPETVGLPAASGVPSGV